MPDYQCIANTLGEGITSNILLSKKVFLFQTILLTAVFLSAQSGKVPVTTTISVQMVGLKEPRAMVGYYYGGYLFKADSTTVDTLTGTFSFQCKGLQPGQFFVTVPKGFLFSFMIDQPGNTYRLRGNIEHPDSLHCENSAENEAYLAFLREKRKKEATIRDQEEMFNLIKQATKDPKTLQEFSGKIAALYQKLDTLERDHIAKYPKLLFSKMLQSSRVPDVPKSVKILNAKGQPSFSYLQWIRKHYWNFTDFKEERLLNGTDWPFFFDEYFNRWTAPIPDSINAAIDRVMPLMPKDGPIYQFAIKRLTQRFETSDRAGADRIFVHLADRYQPVKGTPWLDEATLLRIEYKANTHRLTLTGNPVPPLSLLNEKDSLIALYSINAPYTLLIFYSPLCSHCIETLPAVYEVWEKYRTKGLAAVAVNTDEQTRYWKGFVAQTGRKWINLSDPDKEKTFIKTFNAYNLPVMMLLDKDKKILWKRIPTTELDATFERLLGKIGN